MSEAAPAPDPLTDKAAAAAFFAAHAFKGDRYGPLQRTITFGPDDSPKRGQPRCACKVWGFSDFSQCSSVGKVALADGSRWCGVHSPQAVKRRADAQAERGRQRQLKAAASARIWRDKVAREKAGEAALDALRQILAGHNDPRALAAQVLAQLEPEGEPDVVI